MLNLNTKPSLENKCLLCGKGELSHNAKTRACPIGSGRFPQFSVKDIFTNSGKFTIKSKKALVKWHEAQTAELLRLEEIRREKSTVRAMTYEEVITAMVELLSEETGLAVTVERDRDTSCKIHLATLGDKIRLGYTCVTQYSNGRYGVAGTSAGCFMANDSDKDISNTLYDKFKELETRANKEKQHV